MPITPFRIQAVNSARRQLKVIYPSVINKVNNFIGKSVIQGSILATDTNHSVGSISPILNRSVREIPHTPEDRLQFYTYARWTPSLDKYVLLLTGTCFIENNGTRYVATEEVAIGIADKNGVLIEVNKVSDRPTWKDNFTFNEVQNIVNQIKQKRQEIKDLSESLRKLVDYQDLE